MFKIVQTKENNRTLLSIVPHKWEKNNQLHYPLSTDYTRKDFDGMIRDGKSVPMDYWKVYPCWLKRKNLTYEQAVYESKIMVNESDTDGPEIAAIPEKRSVANRSHIGRPVVANFSNLVSYFIF